MLSSSRGQANFRGLEAKAKEFKMYPRGLHLWQMNSLQLQFEYFFNTNVIVESTYSVLSLWVYNFLTSWRETTHPNPGNPDAKSSKPLHSTFFLKMINVLLLCSIIKKSQFCIYISKSELYFQKINLDEIKSQVTGSKSAKMLAKSFKQ